MIPRENEKGEKLEDDDLLGANYIHESQSGWSFLSGKNRKDVARQMAASLLLLAGNQFALKTVEMYGFPLSNNSCKILNFFWVVFLRKELLL